MKKILLLIVLLVVFIAGNSTHITNGFVEYKFLGKNSNGDYRYKVSFIVIRDCASSQVQFDDEIFVGIYYPNRSRYQSITISKTSEAPVKAQFADSSININFCYRKGVYEKEIMLPPSSLPYTITWVRCCRPDLKNIVSGMGNTFYTRIIPSSGNNSAAVVSGLPVFADVNQVSSFSMGCTDIDGHTLKYKLVKAIQGGSYAAPVPNPESTIPASFPVVNYITGYNEKDVFGASPSTIQLDSTTGTVTFKAAAMGIYVVAVEVEEWDDTTLVGKNYVEQFITVSNHGQAVNRVSAYSAASDTVQKRIFINWAHSLQPAINKFTLERRTDNDPNWKDIPLSGPSVMNHTDTAVEYDTTYWYRVSAHTDSGVFVSNITRLTIHKNTFPVAVQGIQGPQIRLYPNPSGGTITIEMSGQVSGIKLTDIQGRQITIHPVSNTIDVSALPAGIYYLEIQSGGNIYREKVVKVNE